MTITTTLEKLSSKFDYYLEKSHMFLIFGFFSFIPGVLLLALLLEIQEKYAILDKHEWIAVLFVLPALISFGVILVAICIGYILRATNSIEKRYSGLRCKVSRNISFMLTLPLTLLWVFPPVLYSYIIYTKVEVSTISGIIILAIVAVLFYYRDVSLYQLYENRGNAHFNKHEYNRAIAYYTKAIKFEPKEAEAFNNRGLAYVHKGEPNKAIKDYTKAINICPCLAHVYANRGLAYVRTGDRDNAIKDFSKAIELHPYDAISYHNRGVTYGETGDQNNAIKDYTKAIELKPEYSEAYGGRGNAYATNGNHDKAIEDYTKAIELDPDYAGTYKNRAIAYSSKGEYKKSEIDLAKYKSLSKTEK